MKQVRILIIIDNGNRDLLPSKLLQKQLEDLGHIAKCCNKRDFIVNYRDFRPDGCVVPRGDWPFVKAISGSTKVFIMPSEGARLTAETMMSVFIGRIHSLDGSKRLDQDNNVIDNFNHISKVFLWGSQSKKFLMDSGLFSEDQLVISGNSRLDIYRHVPRKNHNGKNFTVGVAFSAKTASMFDGKYRYAETLHSLNEKSHLPLVPEGCHWEDYAWRDFAILRKMIWLIRRVIKDTNHQILLRVGPLENREDFLFLEKLYPGRIKIQERSAQLFDFLSEIDCLLTCWSTTGIEAQLLGIPTIGIPFLINKERLLYHVKAEANGFNTFLRCYHTPESIDEAMDLISSCSEGSLPVTKDREFFDKFIHDVYNWPSDRSATAVIAEEIVKSVGDFRFMEPQTINKYVSLPGPIEAFLATPILPRKLIFVFTRLLRSLMNIKLDLGAGSFKANRAFHSDSNPAVIRLVTGTNLK